MLSAAARIEHTSLPPPVIAKEQPVPVSAIATDESLSSLGRGTIYVS
jgi:hypothetical protein